MRWREFLNSLSSMPVRQNLPVISPLHDKEQRCCDAPKCSRVAGLQEQMELFQKSKAKCRSMIEGTQQQIEKTLRVPADGFFQKPKARSNVISYNYSYKSLQVEEDGRYNNATAHRDSTLGSNNYIVAPLQAQFLTPSHTLI